MKIKINNLKGQAVRNYFVGKNKEMLTINPKSNMEIVEPLSSLIFNDKDCLRVLDKNHIIIIEENFTSNTETKIENQLIPSDSSNVLEKEEHNIIDDYFDDPELKNFKAKRPMLNYTQTIKAIREAKTLEELKDLDIENDSRKTIKEAYKSKLKKLEK